MPKDPTKTIANAWAMFALLAIPSHYPESLRRKYRTMFYAGAESMMRLQYDVSQEDIPDEEFVALMQEWNEEFRRFAREQM